MFLDNISFCECFFLAALFMPFVCAFAKFIALSYDNYVKKNSFRCLYKRIKKDYGIGLSYYEVKNKCTSQYYPDHDFFINPAAIQDKIVCINLLKFMIGFADLNEFSKEKRISIIEFVFKELCLSEDKIDIKENFYESENIVFNKYLLLSAVKPKCAISETYLLKFKDLTNDNVFEVKLMDVFKLLNEKRFETLDLTNKTTEFEYKGFRSSCYYNPNTNRFEGYFCPSKHYHANYSSRTIEIAKQNFEKAVNEYLEKYPHEKPKNKYKIKNIALSFRK